MKWEQLLFRVFDYVNCQMLYLTTKSFQQFYDAPKKGFRKISRNKILSKRQFYSEPMIYLCKEDKNGNPIFENDIIYIEKAKESDSGLFIARIIDLQYVMVNKEDMTHLAFLGKYESSRLEIVGNIYENYK